MIEITLKVDRVDYDALAELLLPALLGQMEQNSLGRIFVRSPEAAQGAATKLLARLSQEKKDELLAKYLNQNRDKAEKALEEMAGRSGVSLRVCDISAKSC